MDLTAIMVANACLVFVRMKTTAQVGTENLVSQMMAAEVTIATFSPTPTSASVDRNRMEKIAIMVANAFLVFVPMKTTAKARMENLVSQMRGAKVITASYSSVKHQMLESQMLDGMNYRVPRMELAHQ